MDADDLGRMSLFAGTGNDQLRELLEAGTEVAFGPGDVRLDSMKRVASAVGEGAMSVYLVHRYLATM